MRNKQRGASLIEFSLILMAMLTLLFGVIEIGRLAMNYTTLAGAARAATRYAIVHGVDRIGSGADGPSGPADYSQVSAVINNYIVASSMKPANLTPIGASVKVQLTYSYTPILTFLPISLLAMTLSTTSEGYICY